MRELESLFAPFDLGGLRLRNRIVMAPCSRHRAHLSGTPTPMMVEYYRQRASAGLIIGESVACSPTGVGYVFTPSLFNEEHVRGWRAVTDAVHEQGGAMVAQVFHAGRMSDELIQPDLATPLAPSAVQPDPMARHYTVTCPRPKRVYQTPRAMTLREVQQTVDDVVIIRKGSLVHAGPLSELGGDGAAPVVVRTPDPERLVDALGAGAQVTRRPDGAIVVTGASPAEVGHAAFLAGCELHELSAGMRDLERVFLELTGDQS